MMYALFQQRFEEQIHTLANVLTKKGCTKQYDKVWQCVGRLQEKYARATQYYTIEVDNDPDSNLATKLHFERTYIMLTDLEAVFRSLKSELDMNPVYHQTTQRVEGHLWITLLAYHLVHRIRLRKAAQPEPWQQVIYQAINLSHHPGGLCKTIIPDNN